MYGVILAGGGGTRLWPLSSPTYPKPFLPIFPDGSLLEKTVERLTQGSELGLTRQDLTIVTDRRYEGLVGDQLGVAVLSEPAGRNTAAAIAFAALTIERDPDDVMVVLPADHLVTEEGLFRAVLADAKRELAMGAMGIESPIVTLGAQANYPATQYGYLVPDLSSRQELNLTSYKLKAFVEKPDAVAAADLIQQPGVAWNAGIFMGRRRAMVDALRRHTDLITRLGDSVRDPVRLGRAYDDVTPVSIDYAVMQPAAAKGQVVMAGMNVGWSDVGTWTALVDCLVGGYGGAARVVIPNENITLSDDDLAVTRDESGRLMLDRGPRAALTSMQPVGYLPSAAQHAAVLDGVLERVNDWETKRHPRATVRGLRR